MRIHIKLVEQVKQQGEIMFKEEKTVELNENMYLSYYRLGQIALLYRDFDSAEENFAKSSYNEKEAKSYFELAKIHMIKNQKEKAVLDITNAMKVDSSYYQIFKKEKNSSITFEEPIAIKFKGNQKK